MENNKTKKVLIIRFGALGDVVHSTELFRSMKRSHTHAQIDYLTFKAPSLLIENDHDLRKVWIAQEKSYKYLLNLAKELKKENYDIILNLQPSIRTRVFTYFIGAKKQYIYKKSFKMHAVENFWSTAKHAFKGMELNNSLQLHIPEHAQTKVMPLINKNKKIVALNMGTSVTRHGRKWPIKYWQELATELLQQHNCEIVLTGSKEDIHLAEQLTGMDSSIKSFCGMLSIMETAALFSNCDLVVSSDTGPLHIATAVNTTCIGLYGAAPISRTGPYGEKHFAISSERSCVPCNRRKCKYMNPKDETTPCLFDIDVEKLINLVNEHNLLK